MKQEEKIIEETLKVKVLVPFRDKYNPVVRYEVGTELEFEAERAADVVARELAQCVEQLG